MMKEDLARCNTSNSLARVRVKGPRPVLLSSPLLAAARLLVTRVWSPACNCLSSGCCQHRNIDLKYTNPASSFTLKNQLRHHHIINFKTFNFGHFGYLENILKRKTNHLLMKIFTDNCKNFCWRDCA